MRLFDDKMEHLNGESKNDDESVKEVAVKQSEKDKDEIEATNFMLIGFCGVIVNDYGRCMQN
ncbi:MAG: hypothetical protein LBF13_04880 [Campylobacteraceae bacterium]|jgi:hypothetical protein|nr:hypothetical protein [Campylobacteraceae bacterium]